MKVTLPLPPNLANSRMHWRVKQKHKKAYWEACSIAVLPYSQWRKWTAPDKAKIKATIYCGGRMDDDNAIARLKWSCDFLVDAAFLQGDRSAQLSWHWPIEQVIKRNQEYRVEITIQEDA